MTVSSSVNKVRTQGNGVLVDFDFTFPVFSSSDLYVYIVDSDNNATLKTIATHYTVYLNSGSPGGTVTMLTAPAADEEVLIVRSIALTQTTDIPGRGVVREEQLETVYDRLVMMAQQLQEQIDRCVKVGVAESTDTVPVFPTAVEGEFVRWDADGNFENVDLEDAVAAVIAAATITAIASATAASAASAAAALVSQNAAAASETAAGASEDAAVAAQAAAEAAQGLAEDAQAAAEAAAAGVNLPSINGGDALKLLRANAGETGFELVAIKDEDDMVSDSATHVASQQSIKAYVDAAVAALDFDGRLLQVDIYTSNNTWTKPSGCTQCLVEVVGGGGAGGSSYGVTSTKTKGCGGGGGGYSRKLVSTPGATEAVTVGAGGTPASVTTGINADGGGGGTSSFGSHCQATGGSGGTSGQSNTDVVGTEYGGGAGGAGSSGDINLTGAAGAGAPHVATGTQIGGAGGAAAGGLGMGGAEQISNAAGNAGKNYGGGGSGGKGSPGSNNAYAGGAGAGGVVIVYSYS